MINMMYAALPMRVQTEKTFSCKNGAGHIPHSASNTTFVILVQGCSVLESFLLYTSHCNKRRNFSGWLINFLNHLNFPQSRGSGCCSFATINVKDNFFPAYSKKKKIKVMLKYHPPILQYLQVLSFSYIKITNLHIDEFNILIES